MTLKTKLFGAGAALLLSTGAALAVPATAQTDLNVRSGPGTQYPVVGSIQDGESVDVGRCTGSWCHVSFSGGSGFANRRYLMVGGGAPGPAVVATPYIYDEPDYGYGYYDYGYSYGPSAFIYANPRFRHRHHSWDGRRWNGGELERRQLGGWRGRVRAARRRSSASLSLVAALPVLRLIGSVPAPGSVQRRRCQSWRRCGICRGRCKCPERSSAERTGWRRRWRSAARIRRVDGAWRDDKPNKRRVARPADNRRPLAFRQIRTRV